MSPPWPPSAAQAPGGGEIFVVVRDADNETLLRTCAKPLFRAAALDENPLRIVRLRDAAINSFVNTGNRMLARPQPPARTIINRKGF